MFRGIKSLMPFRSLPVTTKMLNVEQNVLKSLLDFPQNNRLANTWEKKGKHPVLSIDEFMLVSPSKIEQRKITIFSECIRAAVFAFYQQCN